jgi:hypothetical protein
MFTMSSLSNCEVHFIVEMNQQFVKSIFCPNCQIYITKSTSPSCRHQVGQVADNTALPTHQVHFAKLPTPSWPSSQQHGIAHVPSPLHPVDCTSVLQAAQFLKTIYGLPENYFFSAQTSAPKERLPKISYFHRLPNSEKGSNQCWVGMYFWRYPTDRALKNLYTCKAWRGWACLNV